jgi:N-acetylglutamate synthase-like GNAT family acetyltransferase
MTKNIVYRSPVSESDFVKYYDLRWRILRKPWDQPKGSERVDTEEKSFHIMAELDGKVIGVGCIHELEDGVGRIRFMGVEDEFQNHGIGKKIVRLLEDYALEQGWTKIWLYAREIAWNFYINLEYKIIGDGELLFGVIKHKIMEKEL